MKQIILIETFNYTTPILLCQLHKQPHTNNKKDALHAYKIIQQYK